MAIDPEFLEKLVETFKDELDEQLQVITDGLLSLEKQDGSNIAKIVETIFRAGHNIKGSSRSLGINDVGSIAHKMESLFSAIQKNESLISSSIVDIGLEAVDKMRLAMQSFIEKKSPDFDLDELLQRMDKAMGKDGEVRKTDEHSEFEIQERRSSVLEPSSYKTIRVNLNQLDRISALMDEIQVNRIVTDDYYVDLEKVDIKAKQSGLLWKELSGIIENTLEERYGENERKMFVDLRSAMNEMISSLDKIDRNMHTRRNEIRILSHTLQEEMRMLRLIPASYLLQNFSRSVRDIAHAMNKEVELKIEGEEVKIDKVVLDRLKDPMIHLLRNAIDHGIESQERRIKNGKSTVGVITIKVKEEGSQILIDVSDDGAGMDSKKIIKVALKNGLCKESDIDSLDEAKILDFIFRPGFSTKDIITDVSGRGVGLDVVQSNMSDLKGKISVETTVGKGTTFHLHVPLSLAGERGLIVSSADQLFAIPISSVERVLSIEVNQVFVVEGSQAILLDEVTLPIRSLSSILKIDKAALKSNDKLSVVVIKKGWDMVAFLVDEIIAERDIVIKPLQDPLASVPCVSGGTLSGVGAVIIVLNPSDLVKRALQSESVMLVDFSVEPEKIEEKSHILVVDDSITTRTLEKNVLESKGYLVTVAVDGKEAWDMLQKQHFSLLITDVSMPNMDGFTLTEHVKKSEKLHDLPVIIVTSLDSDQEKRRGVEVGANAYIVKNAFESVTLLQIVQQLV